MAAKYNARVLGHPFLDVWRGRKTEPAADPHAKQAYHAALPQGGMALFPPGPGNLSTSSTTSHLQPTSSTLPPHNAGSAPSPAPGGCVSTAFRPSASCSATRSAEELARVAPGLRGHGVDSGHHVAEQAPESLASSFGDFFAGENADERHDGHSGTAD
jgi:hypothetical protein